jgi:hypothetical protein
VESGEKKAIVATVRCGRIFPTGHPCEYELAIVSDDDKHEPFIEWRAAWQQRSDGVLVYQGAEREARRYAPTRRGSMHTLSGAWRRAWRSFPLRQHGRPDASASVKAKCPNCDLVQIVSLKT